MCGIGRARKQRRLKSSRSCRRRRRRRSRSSSCCSCSSGSGSSRRRGRHVPRRDLSASGSSRIWVCKAITKKAIVFLRRKKRGSLVMMGFLL